MAKKEGNDAKKHNGGFITVIVLLAVILAALAGIAVLSTLGYFGGSSSEDESSEVDESSDVEESDTTTDSNENEQTHTHTYELTYVAPTCTEDGSVTLTCTECEDTYTQSIGQLGHDWDNAYYAHDEENHWLVCPRCGTASETEAHSMVDTTIDPSHEGAGLKVSVCTICDYQTSEAIDPTGHNYISETTKEPSCEEEGEITYTCDCGATYTEAIPATGHTLGSGTLTTVPTCTSEGEISFTCSVCSKTYTETVDMLPHDFSQNIYVGDGEYHQLRCANCEALDSESIEACTYENGIYTTGDDGYLHGVCDKCGSLSSEVITELPASSDGTYTFEVNSGSSLSSALDALSNADTSNLEEGSQSTITLIEDLNLDEDDSESQFEIGVSNVLIDGGEDGVTLHDGHELKISGDNVTLKNLTLDGSEIKTEQEKYAHAIEINGNDVNIENCTIIGGEATTYTSAVLIDLVPSEEEDGEINITGCNITGAFRGIYVIDGGSIHLSVSDTYVESTYAFNETGNTDATFDFTDSTLMGWTSYATTGDVNFTNCTLGFCAVGEGWTSYGYVRPYHAKTTFTNCYFESVISRQARLEDYDLIWYSDPVASDRGCNFTLGCMGSDCVNIFLNCTLDDVVWDSTNKEVISQSTYVITASNIINLIDTDFNDTTYGNTANLSVDGVNFFSYQSLLGS